jgi:erythromycin 3''-O-methyltransferase
MQRRSVAEYARQAGLAAAALESKEARKEYERRFVEREQARSATRPGPITYSRYMNMGYWKDRPRTADEAGEALVKFVGEAAKLKAEDWVLDVGCGLAEQDFFWIGQFGLSRITAIDINPNLIDSAWKRACRYGLSGAIEMQTASAVDLPFEANTYDKVISVEAAFQFMTREEFFREAHRVLRPGGLLVLTDLIPLPNAELRDPRVNPLNMYPRDAYIEKLIAVGFTGVEATSIREAVLEPFTRYRNRQQRWRLSSFLVRFRQRRSASRLDYILATARKPYL